MPSECQSAKWAVRALKAPFKRLSATMFLMRTHVTAYCRYVFINKT